MAKKSSRLAWLIVGETHPNEAQLRLYSSTAADLAKAILLASGALLVIPPTDIIKILLGIAGVVTSGILFIAASKFLKEVNTE